MWYPQFKTVVLTSMFISVLFLAGCGTKNETTTITEQPTTPAIEETTQPTTDESTGADQQTGTTPAATTTPSDSTSTTTAKAYSSTFQSYKTPAGNEEVKVTANIDDKGIVTDVNLEFVANAPMSKKFQALFAEGIDAQVVGKNISDVKVGVVNGSSLTGNGFNLAIDQIETMYNGQTN